MLYRQTPNVQVVTDCGDDIVYEAAVYAESEPDAEKHEGDLINVISKGTRPKSYYRTQAIRDCPSKRSDKDVLVRESIFDKMSGDHLANREGIDEASIKDEWDEVVVQDNGLQCEVGCD